MSGSPAFVYHMSTMRLTVVLVSTSKQINKQPSDLTL